MKNKPEFIQNYGRTELFPGNFQQKTSQGRDFKPCRIRKYDKAMLPAKNP